MPIDVKMWRVAGDGSLREVKKAELNAEERIQKWVEENISVISEDYLLIGGKVATDSGKELDLLCLDKNGDTIIIELKKHKTPREVTSQTLEYASWVKKLSPGRIVEIADKSLGEKGALEKKFKEKFHCELPESINRTHKMLIIASEIDDSTENIIKYLNETWAVPINAVTFNYTKDDKGNEFLVRAFLIEPHEAEQSTQSVHHTTTRQTLTPEEVKEEAQKKGLGDVFWELHSELTEHFYIGRRVRGIAYEYPSGTVLFSIWPDDSNSENGLCCGINPDRFAKYFGVAKKDIKSVILMYEKDYENKEKEEFGYGYFKEDSQVNRFTEKLKEWSAEDE